MTKIIEWKGKNINDLSREELIEALRTMAELTEATREQNEKHQDFLFSLMRNKSA